MILVHHFAWILAAVAAWSPAMVESWRFPPADCKPMSDPSYDPHRHKGLEKELVDISYYQVLYCKYDCCGDGTNTGMQCCLGGEESGLNTLKIVSIIAAGIAALALILLFSVHQVKAHNKKRRLVADIETLQRKVTTKKKPKKIKVGQYQRAPGEGIIPKQPIAAGDIFVTKQALPAIPFVKPLDPMASMHHPSQILTPPTRNVNPSLIQMKFPQARPNFEHSGSTDFTPNRKTAPHSFTEVTFSGDSNSNHFQNVPPPAKYDPDEEVLNSLYHLSGAKAMPSSGFDRF